MVEILDTTDISVTKLVLCEWNCNEMADSEFASLVSTMGEEGFDEPIHVVPRSSLGDKYLIVGGEHRYKAAISNGLRTLPCYILHHLKDADEAELMLWSVRRNNQKGRQNKQKYAHIEQTVCKRMDLQEETARKRMLVRAKQASKTLPTKADTDGEREERKTVADRTRLLADARSFQQECLVDSGDTVEHGYLYVGQNGKSHLIVDASKQLHGFISAMVRVCKKESDRIDEFLTTAIKNELSNWD
jgi:hypothetical protein